MYVALSMSLSVTSDHVHAPFFVLPAFSLLSFIANTASHPFVVASSGKAGGMSQAGFSGSGNLHSGASQDDSPALSKVDVISLLVNCSLGGQQQS